LTLSTPTLHCDGDGRSRCPARFYGKPYEDYRLRLAAEEAGWGTYYDAETKRPRDLCPECRSAADAESPRQPCELNAPCLDFLHCGRCRGNEGCRRCDDLGGAWWAWGYRNHEDAERDENTDSGETCWAHLPEVFDDHQCSDVRLLWAEWWGGPEFHVSFEVWQGSSGRWTATDGKTRRVAATPGAALAKLQVVRSECAAWGSADR
jgi:hypothetical protein